MKVIPLNLVAVDVSPRTLFPAEKISADLRRRLRLRRTLAVLVPPLLCCLILTLAFAAERKYGDSANSSNALFDPSRVIQIEIRLDPKDWHALRISHPDLDENLMPIAMNYEYYRGDVVIDGKPVKSVGVRKKGTFGSTIRPSLKIKLDEYVKNQEFSGLEMLTLNNLAYDPAKAEQSLVYSFMNKAGAISPRSNLARVVVNGEDLGIYGQVESIDKRFIKRHFGNARGDLYEGQYMADFTTNGFKKITHKWGRDDDLAQVRKLMEVLESPGLASLKSIEELVDLDAFLTFWAANVLLGNTDSYPNNANNYYFYRDAKSGKFFMFPWGADAWAFALSPDSKHSKSVWANGYLCRRLWELPEVRERYRKEMRRLLADVWDEKSMLSELELVRRLSRNDPAQDVARRDRAFERIAQTIERRPRLVQAELDVPARDWPSPRIDTTPDATTPNRPPMQVEGSFTAVIAQAFPTNVAGYFGQGTAALQFTVAGETRKPFTRFGSMAVLRADRTEEHKIRIEAADNTGDFRWQIRFTLDPYRMPLTPGTARLAYEDWAVFAQMFQGDPGSPKAQERGWGPNKGTLELTQVSTNFGGTISGKFKINTTAFEEEKK